MNEEIRRQTGRQREREGPREETERGRSSSGETQILKEMEWTVEHITRERQVSPRSYHRRTWRQETRKNEREKRKKDGRGGKKEN